MELGSIFRVSGFLQHTSGQVGLDTTDKVTKNKPPLFIDSYHLYSQRPFLVIQGVPEKMRSSPFPIFIF